MDNETLVDETIEIENPQNGNTEDLISEYITGNYSFKDLSSRFNKESCLYFLAVLDLPNFLVSAVGAEGFRAARYHCRKLEKSITEVYDEIVKRGLPYSYETDYNGTFKRFPKLKKSQLVMEVVMDWFKEQSKQKYVSR